MKILDWMKEKFIVRKDLELENIGRDREIEYDREKFER